MMVHRRDQRRRTVRNRWSTLGRAEAETTRRRHWRGLPAVVALSWLLALLALIGSFALRWGDIGDGVAGPPGGLAAVAIIALLAGLGVVHNAFTVNRGELICAGVIAGGCAVLEIVLHLTLHARQADAGIGSYLSLLCSALLMITALLGICVLAPAGVRGRPGRLVGAVLAVVLVAAGLTGAVWWPGHGVRHTTAAPAHDTVPANPTALIWTRELSAHEDDLIYNWQPDGAPRLVVPLLEGPAHGEGAACRVGVRGIDPRSGKQVWEYSRPAYCDEDALALRGTRSVLVAHGLGSSSAGTVVLDPNTGRRLHPEADTARVAAFLSADRGLIGADDEHPSQPFALVDLTRGTTLWRSAPPTCAAGEKEFFPYSAWPNDQPVLISPGTVAVPYQCRNATSSTFHVWIHSAHGSHTLLLGTTEGAEGAGTLIATGGHLVACFPLLARNNPTRFVGVDPNRATIVWQSADLADVGCGFGSPDLHAVDDHRIATKDGVLDATTGHLLTGYPAGTNALRLPHTAFAGQTAYAATQQGKVLTLIRTNLLSGHSTTTPVTVPEAVPASITGESVYPLPGGIVVDVNGLWVGLGCRGPRDGATACPGGTA